MGLTDTSKFLSLVLRHKPVTIEIFSKLRPFDMLMLDKIV